MNERELDLLISLDARVAGGEELNDQQSRLHLRLGEMRKEFLRAKNEHGTNFEAHHIHVYIFSFVV